VSLRLEAALLDGRGGGRGGGRRRRRRGGGDSGDLEDAPLLLCLCRCLSVDNGLFPPYRRHLEAVGLSRGVSQGCGRDGEWASRGRAPVDHFLFFVTDTPSAVRERERE